MKRAFPKHALPLLAFVLGCVGLVLRLMLYALQEPTGLLPQNHPLHIASVVLSCVTAGLMLYCVRSLDGNPEYFSSSKLAASGAFFAGLWLLPVAFDILEQAVNPLDIFHAVLGFLSIPCLWFTAWRHHQGRYTHFLPHCALCLFFTDHLLYQYQRWSANPQMEDYLLPIFACIFLALTGYYRTGFDVRMGNRRALLFCGLMAGFFCICSLAGEGDKRYYLAGAIWALTNLCVAEPQMKQEDNDHVPA